MEAFRYAPEKVNFGDPKIRIKSISCGAYTSYALAEDGILFSWGSNFMGEMGIGDQAAYHLTCNFPLQVDMQPFAGDAITKVHAFQGQIAFAQTENGHIYFWGNDGSPLTYQVRHRFPLIMP